MPTVSVTATLTHLSARLNGQLTEPGQSQRRYQQGRARAHGAQVGSVVVRRQRCCWLSANSCTALPGCCLPPTCEHTSGIQLAAPSFRRLKRLGRGEKELARSDFQMIPELAGNPFLPRIFEMYDQDGDGYMNAADLRALLDSLTRLANEEARFQCAWQLLFRDSAGLALEPQQWWHKAQQQLGSMAKSAAFGAAQRLGARRVGVACAWHLGPSAVAVHPLCLSDHTFLPCPPTHSCLSHL